jgi:15-cis-phytoene desaturase
VLGGGVTGLSAAHELIERDFAVTVYETRPIPGGKARSMPVPGSGRGGRRDLPAEHGFRFFPGFYRHLPETMKRIPYRGQRGGVFANLERASRVQMCARRGRGDHLARPLPSLPARS